MNIYNLFHSLKKTLSNDFNPDCKIFIPIINSRVPILTVSWQKTWIFQRDHQQTGRCYLPHWWDKVGTKWSWRWNNFYDQPEGRARGQESEPVHRFLTFPQVQARPDDVQVGLCLKVVVGAAQWALCPKVFWTMRHQALLWGHLTL